MEPTREKIVQAARVLLSVCDGAHDLDGSGFNRLDSPRVRKLFEAGQELTDGRVRWLWHTIRKYRGQLGAMGIDYDALIPPAKTERKDLAQGAKVVELSWINSKYGRRVRIAFPYDPKLVEVARALEKRWWDGPSKSWLVPDELEHFDNAMAAFEDQDSVEVKVLAEVAEYFEAARASRVQSIAASKAETSDVEIETKLPLLPFQKAGIQYIEAKNGRALVGDEMGCGKTPQAIGYLLRHPEARPALVVCPATLRVNWIREIGKFSNLTAIVLATKGNVKSMVKLGIPCDHASIEGFDIVVVNYDILGKFPFLAEGKFKTLILDEAHAIKEDKSQRTKKCLELSKVIPNVILLTGTPLMNRPRELWTLTQAIKPTLFPSFFQFGKEFCAAKQAMVPARGGPRAVWDFNGASNLDRLDRILRSEVMVRREKMQVMKELPEKRRVTVPLVLNGHLDEYNEATSEIVKHLHDAKKQRDAWKRKLARMSVEERKQYLVEHAEEAASMGKMVGVMIGEIAKLRKEAAKAKMDTTVERLTDMAGQEKLIVFTHHHEITDVLLDRLTEAGLKVVKVDGREDAAKRQVAIDQFQQGDAQVALLGIMAASVGLTLTASSNVVFVELPWRPGDVEQAEARAWRYGQKNAVTSWFLIAMGTIEEAMAKMLETKREVVNAAVGEQERTVDEEGILDAVLEEVLK